jgi:hypothetical protein
MKMPSIHNTVKTLSDDVTNEIDEVLNQFFSIFFFDIKVYFT